MTHPNRHERELNEIKQRIDTDLEEGKAILSRTADLKAQPNMALSQQHITSLQQRVDAITALLGPLQKELPESLQAATTMLDALDQSTVGFKNLLSSLNYHYGSNHPKLLEFVAPPNARGYAREPEKRLRAHERVAEAFQRHQAEIPKDSRLHKELESVLALGQTLDKAYKTFDKEAKEADNIVRQVIQSLAAYRNQKSLLRRALEAELAHPEDVYKYIPKRTYTSNENNNKNTDTENKPA